MTASSASAGLCSSAYCTTSARASARAAAGSGSGPAGSSHTVPLAGSATATGRSGTMACPRRNRRSASAVIGSMPSTGPVCGAIRRVASHWSPSPIRSCPKSGSAGPRSHSRPAASTAGQAAGSGCSRSSTARCSAAIRRTRRRSRGQVAQVVAAVLVDPGGPVGTAAAAGAGQHHAQGRDREHPAEQPRRRVARPEDGDEPDRPEHHHRRQQPGQHARSAPRRSGSGGGSTSSSPPGSRAGIRGGRATSTVHVGPISGLRTGTSSGRREFGRTATAADLALSCFGPGC